MPNETKIIVELEVLRLVSELEKAVFLNDTTNINRTVNLLKAHLTSNREYLSDEVIQKLEQKLKRIWEEVE